MKKTLIYILSTICVGLCIGYLVYNIIEGNKEANQAFVIVNSILIIVVGISITLSAIMALKKDDKILTSILPTICLILLVGFNLLSDTGLIKLPTQKVVENFHNESITSAMDWASANKINLDYSYEYSDLIPEYHIITQDVEPGVLTKDVKDMSVIVSEGPNYEKVVTIPNMTGWKALDVLEFIKTNFLNNVDVEFIISNEQRHTLISQSFIGDMKRNQKLKLVLSLGTEEEQTPFKVIDFTDMSLFEATFYLKMYGIKYDLTYDFSSKIKKNNVMKQSVAKDNILKYGEKITLTISKGKEIVVPDIMSMKSTDVMNWIIENSLTLNLSEKYDSKIKKDYLVSANVKKGDKVSEGDVISIVVSKGPLKMEEFKSANDLIAWANENEIKVDIKYEFSNNHSKDSIVSISAKPGDNLGPNDIITLIISKGKAIEVQNFIGMNESNALKKCKDAGFKCNTRKQYSNSVAKGNVISQSIAAGTNIEQGSTILLNISMGKEVTVTVPNFIGKSWGTIQNECNNLGLSCSKVTGGYSTSYGKDVAMQQSLSKGTIVKPGTSMSVTVSKGAPQSVTITLNASCFNTGSYSAAVSCFRSDMASYINNGYIVNFQAVNSEAGPGRLASCSGGISSPVVTMTQGQAIKICLGS